MVRLDNGSRTRRFSAFRGAEPVEADLAHAVHGSRQVSIDLSGSRPVGEVELSAHR